MPRGGLQIVQPSHLGEGWTKLYSHEFHIEDRATWHAIVQKGPVTEEECWPGGFEESRYYREFLSGGRLRHLVAAPVEAPVLKGFAGALHVYRTAEIGPFTDHERRAIGDAAKQLAAYAAEARASRVHGDCAHIPAWVHQTATRQVVFDSSLRLLLDEDMGDLEDRIADQIRADAKHRLQHLPEERSVADRLAVPDSNGELWTFRITTFKNYPALNGGPVVIYGMEPTFCDWRAVRATDLAADEEVCRLIPAMQFMQEEFRRGPTLGEISRTVHLSPFHFHRRFTELLGITPKHFQLECQIFHAKLLLASQEISLAEIAKTCAFAHQSHFTSRFKQATGLTPTRWRKLALRLPEIARAQLGARR